MTGSLARTTADAYIDAVNAVDLDGLVALFAEDAVLDHAVGTFQGTDAIRAFYAENVLAFAPQVEPGDWLEQGVAPSPSTSMPTSTSATARRAPTMRTCSTTPCS